MRDTEPWPLLEGFRAGRSGADHPRARGADFDRGWQIGVARSNAEQGHRGRRPAAGTVVAGRKGKAAPLRTERWLRAALAHTDKPPAKTRGRQKRQPKGARP